MNIPEIKKFRTPEPCGSIGDSITVEELAEGRHEYVPITEMYGLISARYDHPLPLSKYLLKFSCNGEELLIERDRIDAIVRTAPGSQARAGVAVSGKVFYVDDDYETVKEKVFGVRA